MKILRSEKQERGMTLVEVAVVIAVIAILVLMLLPRNGAGPARALRIQCVLNLKQVGLAYRVWEGDHGNSYPMAVAETSGGTMGFVTGPSAFRHFLVMSNELVTPKVLLCPAESDRKRTVAMNFNVLGNSNLSYFVGIDANETNVQMILSGDHNITNGTAVNNGMLDLSTNHPAGWTSEVHNKVGNILMADGSAQQLSVVGLQTTAANTGFVTNRLQMPILSP